MFQRLTSILYSRPEAVGIPNPMNRSRFCGDCGFLVVNDYEAHCRLGYWLGRSVGGGRVSGYTKNLFALYNPQTCQVVTDLQRYDLYNDYDWDIVAVKPKLCRR